MRTQFFFDPLEFHACFMVTAEAASRWRSLALLALPPPGEYKDLQIVHPLQHLESFKLALRCDLGSFLEPLLNAITTTVTPRFTVMEIFHPDAAPYLLRPVHFQIFSSLTTLRLVCKTMESPVDVLPSLHKLEIFEAHHLSLPIYPPDVDLPLVQTLRILNLKFVSVQWMEARTFPAVEECSITFPHHADAIRSVYMPSCSILKYDSNNLGTLGNFRIPPLDRLEVKCGQWRTLRGDLQLVALHPIFAAQSLTCLHLEIKCSEWLLVHMLRLAPALEELWMGLSSPRTLSIAFFLALAAGGRNANAGRSSQAIAPLGRELRLLHLRYKRWLRGPGRNALIAAFGAIMVSHPPEKQTFSFQLSFDEGSESQEWNIHKPEEIFDSDFVSERIIVGVSSPDGVVSLSRDLLDSSLIESGHHLLPRESEYIETDAVLVLPIDFFISFHSLTEVIMFFSRLEMEPDTQFPLSAPLFHTLKVLHMAYISSSFMAGQTFHKLERYDDRTGPEDIPGQGPLTEMPVCTRLGVPLIRLAALKLPQLHELRVCYKPKYDHIWEKYISVNGDQSGLKLLHLSSSYSVQVINIGVIKILRSLPALETLIIDIQFHNVSSINFFEAFVPMNVPGSSGLNRSSWEGQIPGILCPRLESVHIEGVSPTRQAELMPVLKKIVTLRAIIGSPLKSFTFYSYENSKGPQKWQLIGRDKSFMMEEVVPAERFQLAI